VSITAAQVNELRKVTGAGLMDCKKALTECDGDQEKSVDYLRKKGLAAASKKAGRVATEGLVGSYIHAGGKIGVLVEVNCETDFVAKNEQFQVLAGKIAEAALANKVADRLALLTTVAENGKTVEQLIEEASASIKEKIELGRYARFEGGYVSSYLHRSDRDLPPTLGVLVQLDKPSEGVARDLAQQIAAMRPQYVTRDEVPADVTEKERRIAEQITRDEGKPEQAIPKIVEGRLGAFYKDVVLTEQAFVKEPKQSVAQVLKGDGVTVRGFARFQVGQA
jgi:elongation factor Ts